MPAKLHLLRWLTLAALADWLITRSLARMAIFMPKSPLILSAYSGLIWVGQYASTLCALVGMLAILWLVWRSWAGGKPVLSLALTGLLALNVLFIVEAPGAWLSLFAQALLTGTIAWLSWLAWKYAHGLDRKLSVLLPGLAVFTGSLSHALQALGAALISPEPYFFTTGLFNLGELLFVLSPLGLWYAYGRERLNQRAVLTALWALLPAAAFMAARLANPSMTGILAIWSTGLTLYLPAPVYALSLWLAGITVLVSRRTGSLAGTILILMIAAGYAPQLSSQVSLSLVALSLLAGLWQGETVSLPAPSPAGQGSETTYRSEQPLPHPR